MHVTGGGVTHAGFKAFRFLMLRMPLTAPLALFMFLPGVPWIGDRAYRWVASHRHSTLACRIGEPTILHKFFASAFILLVLGVVGAGTVLRAEDWPLTCAPMFATPVEQDGARYSFRFYAVDAKGESSEIASRDSGVPELRLKRLFFRAYGSTDPGDPYGGIEADTPEAFEGRMAVFFDAFVAAAQERGELKGARAIRVVVRREAGGRGESHRVGTYDLATRRFTR